MGISISASKAFGSILLGTLQIALQVRIARASMAEAGSSTVGDLYIGRGHMELDLIDSAIGDDKSAA